MKSNTKKERIKLLVAYAEDNYSKVINRNNYSIMDHLILALLARRSSHSRAVRYLEAMHKEFVDWNEARISTETQIARSIGRSDWTNEASEVIRHLLETVYAQYHEVSLEFLRELTSTQVRGHLMRLPHIDRPMADEVILFALDVPTLPYGAPQALTCYRLGLAPDERTTVTNQRSIEKLFEPEKLTVLHYFLSEFTTTICVPDSGKCEDCPLLDCCPAAPRKRTTGRGRGTAKLKATSAARKKKKTAARKKG